jgi:hormone-sensitive lipase
MSSFIHQIYVRAWTNELEVPFVSVDYGKAPEHPYPESLYDCLEAYLWVLYCFEQLYEAKPQRIVFLGDSSGGNLVAALINLCIAWKLRVPDGLVMCYPVLKVNSKSYTHSLLGTLEDMILPHTMLKLCAQSYTPNF